jgi:hypothetical protein
MKKILAGIVAVSLLAAPAQAGGLTFEAVPQDGASTTLWLGAPKTIQQRERGKVSVVPRGIEQGRLAFDVEVHNLGEGAAFFGHESVEVEAADRPLALANLDRAGAKNKVNWGRVGATVVLVALVGAAAMAMKPEITRTSYYTTRSPARAAKSPAGDPEQEAARATSVPSRHLYSGRIFVERPKGRLKGQELSLRVSFNGETYPFAFRVSEGG